MERQTYTNTNRYLFLFLIALMVSCSKSDVQIAKSLNKEIAIYPDYKDVTIPVNIAPLNFSIADSSEHCLIIKGEKTQLQVYSDEGSLRSHKEMESLIERECRKPNRIDHR